MREVIYVLLFLAVLLTLGSVSMVSWEVALKASTYSLVIGFALGLPTGVVYHVQLYKVLSPRDELPAGWFWSPIGFNRLLSAEDRSRVMPWCYMGGFGFVLIVLGLLGIGMSMMVTIAQISGGPIAP